MVNFTFSHLRETESYLILTFLERKWEATKRKANPLSNLQIPRMLQTLSRRQLLLSLLYGEAIALLVWLSPREKGPWDPPPSGPFSFVVGRGDTQRALQYIDRRARFRSLGVHCGAVVGRGPLSPSCGGPHRLTHAEHPVSLHGDPSTTIDPNVSRETFGSQPKQTAPTFALIRRGILISPQEQQSSKKKRHRKAASIDSSNTTATFCRNRVSLRNLHSISAPETHQL